MNRAISAVVAGSVSALTVWAGQPVATQPAPPAPAATKPAPAKPAAQPAVAPKPFDPLLAKVRSTLDEAAAGGDLAAATATINGLWDWTCVNVPVENAEVFLEVGAAQRLMGFLPKYSGDKKAVIKLLRASPRLMNALMFQIAGGEGDEPGAVLTVLMRLSHKFPAKQLEEMANLTTAVCVVYDRPLIKQVNENEGKGPVASEAFEYYTKFEGRMVFSPRTMPVELLIYTVDPGAKLEEMAWALDRYGGQREVGPRYNEIKYDNDHFKRGKEKKITTEGFNLQNIKKYGGICADQAHFASTVGKSIGVPAVVDSGASSDVGHAWLGFLKKNGRSYEWNFDAGRYDQYEDIRGSVTDPQTGATIPDGTLALTAESLSVSDAARQASAALVDAAARLSKMNASASPSLGGVELTLKDPPTPRTAKSDDRQSLLRAALTLYSANHRAWNALRAMATAKELTPDQKTEWGAALQSMCGNKYPDFTLAVLSPMVASIDDVAQQSAIWETLFKRMRGTRPDLAAEVLIEQGKMWEKAGKPEKAYDSFTAAAYPFINDSPASVDALRMCEKMLKDKGAPQAVLPLWANAWKRLSKPEEMAQEFMTQSNWYKVGMRYCSLLDADGQTRKAEQVRRTLGEDERSIQRRDRQSNKP